MSNSSFVEVMQQRQPSLSAFSEISCGVSECSLGEVADKDAITPVPLGFGASSKLGGLYRSATVGTGMNGFHAKPLGGPSIGQELNKLGLRRNHPMGASVGVALSSLGRLPSLGANRPGGAANASLTARVSSVGGALSALAHAGQRQRRGIVMKGAQEQVEEEFECRAVTETAVSGVLTILPGNRCKLIDAREIVTEGTISDDCLTLTWGDGDEWKRNLCGHAS